MTTDLERAAQVCEEEAKLRRLRSENPFPGDDSMAQGHKAVTASILANRIRALSPTQPEGWVSAALTDVAAERARQVEVEEWSPGHDDLHTDGELAAAAACYAMSAAGCDKNAPNLWPWHPDWWKPKDARRDLVRAAALIVAEIERIDRSMPKQTPSPPSPASPQTEPPGVQEIIALQNYIRGDSPHPASDPLRAKEVAPPADTPSPVEQMDIPAMLRASEVACPKHKLLPHEGCPDCEKWVAAGTLSEEKIYTKADAEALCEIAVAAGRQAYARLQGELAEAKAQWQEERFDNGVMIASAKTWRAACNKAEDRLAEREKELEAARVNEARYLEALRAIEKWSQNCLTTDSKDRGDWIEDMGVAGRIATAARQSDAMKGKP